MYVCIYVNMYIYVFYVYSYVYTCTVYRCIYVHMYSFIVIFMYMYICSYACICTCVCACADPDTNCESNGLAHTRVDMHLCLFSSKLPPVEGAQLPAPALKHDEFGRACCHMQVGPRPLALDLCVPSSRPKYTPNL